MQLRFILGDSTEKPTPWKGLSWKIRLQREQRGVLDSQRWLGKALEGIVIDWVTSQEGLRIPHGFSSDNNQETEVKRSTLDVKPKLSQQGTGRGLSQTTKLEKIPGKPCWGRGQEMHTIASLGHDHQIQRPKLFWHLLVMKDTELLYHLDMAISILWSMLTKQPLATHFWSH